MINANDDGWMQKEHQDRRLQIKHLLGYLDEQALRAPKKGLQTRAQRTPPPIVSFRSPSREERRRLFLLSRKHDQTRQGALREDRELKEIAKTRRIAIEREHAQLNEKKSKVGAKKAAYRKIVAAERHSSRLTIRYRGWLPWVRRMENRQLQEIKAQRHHQYCFAQNVWVQWTVYVQTSRAAKIQSRKKKITRVGTMLELKLQRGAWGRWRHHQRCLALIGSRVRDQVHLARLSFYWHRWILAWTNRAQSRSTLLQRAIRMGSRVLKSRLFRAWKMSVETARARNILDEERHQIWQQVNGWLAFQPSFR